MRGRGLVARRVEILAERGAQRLLVAGRDLDLFHDGQPIPGLLGLEQLAERGKLGLQLLARKLGGGGGGPAFGLRGARLLFNGLGRGKLGLVRSRWRR